MWMNKTVQEKKKKKKKKKKEKKKGGTNYNYTAIAKTS